MNTLLASTVNFTFVFIIFYFIYFAATFLASTVYLTFFVFLFFYLLRYYLRKAFRAGIRGYKKIALFFLSPDSRPERFPKVIAFKVKKIKTQKSEIYSAS